MSYSDGKTRRPQNWWRVQHTRQTVWGSEYIKNSDIAVRKWPTSKRKMGKWAKTWVHTTKNNKHKWPEIHEPRSISSVIKDVQTKPSRAAVLHLPFWQKPRNLMISSASEDTLVKIEQKTEHFYPAIGRIHQYDNLENFCSHSSQVQSVQFLGLCDFTLK